MNVTSLPSSATPYARAAGASSSPPAVVQAEADGRYNSSTMVTLTYSAPDSEEHQALYERTMRHVSGPMLASDDSIRTIEDRLKKFQKNLSLARPDLAKSDWDVTIKDGKLKVTGDIDPDDKRYMEARLNSDQALVGAVGSYMRAAEVYLETSEDNPPYTAMNGDTGRSTLYNFKDVNKQLEGKVSFKELIATSWAAYDNPRGGPPSDPGNYRGGRSLEILASRLTSTPLE
ncbi:hypothetical protein ACQ86G_13655 [Roseateles chitinivorans]|uniref:hypothetical protein n=1 Tax=Roseateles chitinivorans TaxID=2917965 RepID=UPI003D66F72E